MEPMTISKGKEELNVLRTEFQLENNFIIFMDECCVSEGEECKNRFRFLRNIIRNLGIIIVLMGTNADSANFVDGRSIRTSRPRNLYT